MKYDHTDLKKKASTHKLYSDLVRDGKEIVFVWVPCNSGIGRTSAADPAAEEALDGDFSDEYIPFSSLKPRLNN